MRSTGALLGFLLASAQAFYAPPAQTFKSKPSFMGQPCVRRGTASRTTLRASLEDIERKLIEQEKKVVSAAKDLESAAKEVSIPFPAPDLKDVVPAPKVPAPVSKALPSVFKPKSAPGKQREVLG